MRSDKISVSVCVKVATIRSYSVYNKYGQTTRYAV